MVPLAGSRPPLHCITISRQGARGLVSSSRMADLWGPPRRACHQHTRSGSLSITGRCLLGAGHFSNVGDCKPYVIQTRLHVQTSSVPSSSEDSLQTSLICRVSDHLQVRSGSTSSRCRGRHHADGLSSPVLTLNNLGAFSPLGSAPGCWGP